MKLKELEAALEQIEGFGRGAKIDLEQYVTPAHVAARMIHVACEQGDIDGKYVCDLGAGTGALSVGAALRDAAAVLSIEVDREAVEVLSINADDFDVKDKIDPLIGDVFKTQWIKNVNFVDTILMNPPFGTRNKGADVAFLETALSLAPTVYSLHKMTTRDHIVSVAERFGGKAEPLATIKYPLPRSYSFHSKQSQDIAVDFIKFVKT